MIPSGDTGIIRCLTDSLFITAVREKKVYLVNTQIEFISFDIDLKEARFKGALSEGRLGIVTSTMRSAKLCSDSIIDFLQRRGHPEVALLFVTDPKQKFTLALQSSNMEVAKEAATAMNDPDTWEALANAAIAHGLFQLAEVAPKKAGNLERLGFLYLIAGAGK
jgi:coatomer protein complex subunit alpha (xenin)